MREEIGGVRYDAEARLQFGAPEDRAELSSRRRFITAGGTAFAF